MKKIVTALSFFFFCSLSATQPPEPLIKDFSIHHQILIDYAQLLQKQLIGILEHCYTNLSYWQSMQDRPLSRWLRRIPHRLLSDPHKNYSIEQKITLLEQYIDRYAAYLGLLKTQREIVESSHTKEQAKQEAFSKLNKTIFACLRESLTTSPTKHDELLSLHEIKKFKKRTMAQLSFLNRPRHLTHYWIEYTVAAGITLATLTTWQKKSAAIKQWLHATKNSSHRFYETYAKKPIENIINIFYGNDHDDTIITEGMIADNIELYKMQIKNYYKKYYFSKKTNQEIERIAQEAIQTKQLPHELRDELARQWAYPLWNLCKPSGQLVTLEGIEFRNFFNIALSGIQKVNTVFKANKLNFELLLAIPAALIFYGSYKGLQHGYYLLSPHLYKPIKQRILAIERLLNNAYKPPQELTFKEIGLIYFHVDSLKKAAQSLPLTHRRDFYTDIAELDASSLRIKQKLKTIERMQRTYPFLKT